MQIHLYLALNLATISLIPELKVLVEDISGLTYSRRTVRSLTNIKGAWFVTVTNTSYYFHLTISWYLCNC